MIKKIIDDSPETLEREKGMIGESMIEKDVFVVTKLPALGNGQGSIDVEDRLKSSEDPLSQEHLEIVEREINNPNNMVSVTDPDSDGCPDGRKADKFENLTDRINIIRQKVFGGGLTMTMAGIVGNGRAIGKKLKESFASGLDLMANRKIDFGAHTSVAKKEGNSGCGAIDEAFNSWKLAVNPEFKKDAIATINALAGDKGEGLMPAIEETYKNIEDTFPSFDEQNYSGQKVVDGAVKRGKIVAVLDGIHREVAIVINVDLEDKTFDQSKIRSETDDVAQVFSVDVPRMRRLADQAYDDPEEKQKALISMFIYSLAVATVLTKNDLPIYLISQTDNPAIDFSFN